MQKVLTDKNADIDQLLADAETQVNHDPGQRQVTQARAAGGSTTRPAGGRSTPTTTPRKGTPTMAVAHGGPACGESRTARLRRKVADNLLAYAFMAAGIALLRALLVVPAGRAASS